MSDDIRRTDFSRWDLGSVRITRMPDAAKTASGTDTIAFMLVVDANPMPRSALVELRDLATRVLDECPDVPAQVPTRLDPKGGLVA